MKHHEFKTSKGTHLPVMDIRGKSYLQVAYRLVWFREDHPDWIIKTSLIKWDENMCLSAAEIYDEAGKMRASAHKLETLKGFPDYIEKAETGAIGRALALCGYGTQFCGDELDEGQRLADSPLGSAKEANLAHTNASVANELLQDHHSESVLWQKVQQAAKHAPETPVYGQGSEFNPSGNYVVNFGNKYKGRKIKDINREELANYVKYLETSGQKSGKMTNDAKRLIMAYNDYFGPAPKKAVSKEPDLFDDVIQMPPEPDYLKEEVPF